jgi:hypothetical protein
MLRALLDALSAYDSFTTDPSNFRTVVQAIVGYYYRADY